MAASGGVREGWGGIGGVGRGVCGLSFVRNSSKRRPSYLSTGALCNGILHCHFAPFIFRQGYYCGRGPEALCARTGSGFNFFFLSFFFFQPVQNSLSTPSSPPPDPLASSTLEVMDHGPNEHSANSRPDWEGRRKSGCCVCPAAN